MIYSNVKIEKIDFIINNDNSIEFNLWRDNISFSYQVTYNDFTKKFNTFDSDFYVDLIKEKYNIG